MTNQILTLLLFIGILYLIYAVFSNMNGMKYTEGLTNNDSTSNGIAGNAASYAANIKAEVIKNQDTLLISKYRNDYENVVLNLDDLVNTLMLQAALDVNLTNPINSLNQLFILNNVKASLNNIMKFIDSSR